MTDKTQYFIEEFSIEGDFIIHLVFDDGKKQRIDFSEVKQRGDWKRLEDAEYFKKVYLNDASNLEWPEGQDFKPKDLYYWDEVKDYYCS